MTGKPPVAMRTLGSRSASTIGLILASFGSAVFVVRLVLPPIVHRLSDLKVEGCEHARSDGHRQRDERD